MANSLTAHEIAKSLSRGRQSRDGWIASCPVPGHGRGRGDLEPSLSIRDENGRVLVHCHGGCEQDQVIGELRRRGLWPESNVVTFAPKERGPLRPIPPVPEDAPDAPGEHPTLGQPTTVWPYINREFARVFEVWRFDDDGEKTYRPLSWKHADDGTGCWDWSIPDGLRPLYNLPALLARPGAPVVVCEGEKAADAASRLLPGWIAVTSSSGANSAEQTDWSDLAGHPVVFWRDNDDPGLGYAKRAGKLIWAAGPLSLAMIEPPEPSSLGWDAADAEDEGWTCDQVKDLIAKATPYQATKLRAMSLDELLNAQFPPREMIVGSWLPKKGLALIYAKRGVGKTFFALGLAVAVATGKDFLGYKVPKSRKVLYIDGEMPVELLQERLRFIAGGAEASAKKMISFLVSDCQSVGIPDISTTEGQDAINEHLQGVELVIVDNLSSLTSYGKENEGESWLPLQTWALTLRRRGISVLFVHHAAKGGQQRGTSRREDVLDTIISLRHPEGYSPHDGARFEIHFEKSRSSFGKETDPVEVALRGEADIAMWSTRPVVDELEEAIRQVTGENPDISRRKLAQTVGKSLTTVHRAVKRIEDADRAINDIDETDDAA